MSNSSLQELFAFYSIFNSALTSQELKIFGYKNFKKWPYQQENFFFSPQVDFQHHLKSRENEKKLWKKIRRYQFLFKICPFIKLVCVCNSLSFHASKENSDIDLVIITHKNRLFIARFLLTILTHLFKVRRHGKRISSRFCLSFWMSEEALNLETYRLKKDPYFAYWFQALVPLTGEKETYLNLFKKNWNWLRAFLPQIPKRKVEKSSSTIKKCLQIFFDWDFLENFLKKRQIKRAQKKASRLKKKDGTVITPTLLKFHDQDRRKEFFLEWRKKLIATKL